MTLTDKPQVVAAAHNTTRTMDRSDTSQQKRDAKQKFSTQGQEETIADWPKQIVAALDRKFDSQPRQTTPNLCGQIEVKHEPNLTQRKKEQQRK